MNFDETGISRKTTVSSPTSSRIRRYFKINLRQKGAWDVPSSITPSLEALFDAVGAVIDEKETEGPITLGTLEGLTTAPSRYSGNPDVEVHMDLRYLPGKGWKLRRDDADGAGPWYEGEFAPTPEEAIKSFMDLIENRDKR